MEVKIIYLTKSDVCWRFHFLPTDPSSKVPFQSSNPQDWPTDFCTEINALDCFICYVLLKRIICLKANILSKFNENFFHGLYECQDQVSASEKVCFPKISLEVDYDKATVLISSVSSTE